MQVDLQRCTKCALRSSDHYVNNTSGETTSVWFDRRRRIPHPLGGLEGANWSANVREILKCPATPQSISKSSKSALNQLEIQNLDTRFLRNPPSLRRSLDFRKHIEDLYCCGVDQNFCCALLHRHPTGSQNQEKQRCLG